MATTSNLGSLSGATAVAAEASALSSTQTANTTDLWPIQSWGTPNRQPLAGIPSISPVAIPALEQGRFLESSIGQVSTALQIKNLDITEKIKAYLDLNRVTNSAKLPDAPRSIKLAADSVHLLQVVQSYIQEAQGLATALQADIAMLAATEKAMQNMIQANLNALANLLNEICNFGLPKLPSLPALLNMFHWNGFNFTFDFSLKSLSSALNVSSLASSFSLPNFTFSACQVSTPNLASLFNATTSIPVDTLTASIGSYPLPLSGSLANADELTDPDYITTMQATTTAVYNPSTITPTSTSSLPNPASIVSNYSLTPDVYEANIVSIIPGLQSIVIQPGDADYGAATPSTSRTLQLQSLLAEYVTLGTIVASNYDANLIAAWLIYLDLNHTGRAGTWLVDYETLYTSTVTPSVTYLANTPVPWNSVLGGTEVNDEPVGIPLQSLLQADTTGFLHWQLSYIEAGLLGYVRNTTWDSVADLSLTAPDTGNDLDYVASTISATTTQVTLGVGTAAEPSLVTIPTSISVPFNAAVAIASIAIQATPSFLSSRPQYRYTYDMFGNATLVDRFTQFWRQYAGNVQTLLAGDAYTVAFAVHYAAIIDAAVSPLASTDYYTNLTSDTASRNRSWSPGSVLPQIPTAISSASISTPPTTATNGWTGGTFNAAAYLARPDVQAQSLPTQVAMLRTNQSYASLMTLSNSISTACAAATATAQAAIANSSIPGWQVETAVAIAVPPGAIGITLEFLTTDSDQTHYVTSGSVITVQNTGPYALVVNLNFDTTGTPGVRTATLLQNGASIASASSDTINQPFVVQLSTIAQLSLGDTLSVQVTHALSTSQNMLAGSSFLGILDSNASSQDTQVIGSQGSASLVAANTFSTDSAFPAFTAVAIGSDGNTSPLDPTVSTMPYVDGISLVASTGSGDQVTVVTAYGALVTFPEGGLTPGSLLYVNTAGALVGSQSALAGDVLWILVAGRVVTPTSFLFEPHLPISI